MDKTKLHEMVMTEVKSMLAEIDVQETGVDHFEQAFFSLGFLASYTNMLDLKTAQDFADQMGDRSQEARAAIKAGATSIKMDDD